MNEEEKATDHYQIYENYIVSVWLWRRSLSAYDTHLQHDMRLEEVEVLREDMIHKDKESNLTSLSVQIRQNQLFVVNAIIY